LCERLLEDFAASGGSIPSFEEAEISISPEARAAAEFLIEILPAKEDHE
jgi:hypothetical protein